MAICVRRKGKHSNGLRLYGTTGLGRKIGRPAAGRKQMTSSQARAYESVLVSRSFARLCKSIITHVKCLVGMRDMYLKLA